MKRLGSALAVGVLCIYCAFVFAQELATDIGERIVRLPVHGVEMLVTVFLPRGNGPFPLILINHGRAGTTRERASVPRFRYTAQARLFVHMGFAVIVPTRVGYGPTGGPDLEDHGRCASAEFAKAFEGALASIRTALAWAHHQSELDTSRLIVMGTSVGGVASLALAAGSSQGVRAAVNFSGGKGGNPRNWGQPCNPVRLGELIEQYGRTTRVPTLWIYAENDNWFGPGVAREWHGRYLRAGAQAEFVMLPPFGPEGHYVFTRAIAHWRPIVERFLAAHR